MLHTWKNHFKKDHFIFDHQDPTVFVTSQWQSNPRPSLLYFIYRWLVTLFFLISWITSTIDIPNLGQSAINHLKWLIFLTNWGYTLCTIQTCLCTILLTVYFIKYSEENKEAASDVGRKAILPFYNIYWLINTVATDMAFGITVIYWTLIYNEKEMPLDAINIMVHGMNSFLMLLDLWIVAHPIRILHLYAPVLFGFIYVLFSVIYYYAGGTNKKGQVYIYPILNWANPGKTVLVCIGVTIFVILIHCCTFGMYRLRSTINERLRTKKKEEETKFPLNHKNSLDYSSVV